MDVDDDSVDLGDGADETPETAVVDDDINQAVTKSPDGETTILFIKPRPGLVGLSGTPGKYFLKKNIIHNQSVQTTY